MTPLTWTLSHHHGRIRTVDYVARYVDLSQCLARCQGCPSLGTTWACPPHEDDLLAIWARYEWLHVEAAQLHFSASDQARQWQPDQMRRELAAVRDQEKHRATAALQARVENLPRTRLLHGGGPCMACSTCTRLEGRACPFPDRIQYSINSLGGDVLRTATDLLGVTLQWSDGRHLPASTAVILGVLSDQELLPGQLNQAPPLMSVVVPVTNPDV